MSPDKFIEKFPIEKYHNDKLILDKSIPPSFPAFDKFMPKERTGRSELPPIVPIVITPRQQMAADRFAAPREELNRIASEGSYDSLPLQDQLRIRRGLGKIYGEPAYLDPDGYLRVLDDVENVLKGL